MIDEMVVLAGLIAWFIRAQFKAYRALFGFEGTCVTLQYVVLVFSFPVFSFRYQRCPPYSLAYFLTPLTSLLSFPPFLFCPFPAKNIHQWYHFLVLLLNGWWLTTHDTFLFILLFFYTYLFVIKRGGITNLMVMMWSLDGGVFFLILILFNCWAGGQERVYSTRYCSYAVVSLVLG